MKKIAVALVCALALICVVSCASNHKIALSQNKGVVGKNGIERPDWVIYDMSNDETHYVSAYGEGKTFEVAKAKAKLNADADLALWVSNKVEAIRERFISEDINNTSNDFIDTFVLQNKEAGTAVLSGIVEEDFWEDGEGGVWVLLSIPVANVKAQIDSAIATTAADTSVLASGTDINIAVEVISKIVDEVLAE